MGNLAAGLGGIGLVVGSAAPWASIQVFAFHRDIAGTSLDGKFTVVAGIAVILAAVISMTVDWAGWLLVGLGLASGAVAVYDLVDLSGSVGWGLVVCVVSAAVVIVGGVSEILDL